MSLQLWKCVTSYQKSITGKPRLWRLPNGLYVFVEADQKFPLFCLLHSNDHNLFIGNYYYASLPTPRKVTQEKFSGLIRVHELQEDISGVLLSTVRFQLFKHFSKFKAKIASGNQYEELMCRTICNLIASASMYCQFLHVSCLFAAQIQRNSLIARAGHKFYRFAQILIPGFRPHARLI